MIGKELEGSGPYTNEARRCWFLIPARQEIVLISKGPDRLRSPTSLQFNGYRGSFPGIKRPGREVDSHLHLVRRLMSGAVPALPLYAFVAGVEISLCQRCFCGRSKTTKDLSRDLNGRPSGYQVDVTNQ